MPASPRACPSPAVEVINDTERGSAVASALAPSRVPRIPRATPAGDIIKTQRLAYLPQYHGADGGVLHPTIPAAGKFDMGPVTNALFARFTCAASLNLTLNPGIPGSGQRARDKMADSRAHSVSLCDRPCAPRRKTLGQLPVHQEAARN